MKTKFVEIRLTRDALLHINSRKEIDNISIYDFHTDFLTLNEINTADNIIFIDFDGTQVYLKKR